MCRNLSVHVLTIFDDFDSLKLLESNPENETPLKPAINSEAPQIVEPLEKSSLPKKRGRKRERNTEPIEELLELGQPLSIIATAAGCSQATVRVQKKEWLAKKAVTTEVSSEPQKRKFNLRKGRKSSRRTQKNQKGRVKSA